MTSASRRSLWPTLHDGVLEEVRHEAGGDVVLVIDVPHLRAHAALPAEARFVVRLRGAPSLSATRWSDPSAPRPAGGDETASAAWRALGSMRSIDWDALVLALAHEKRKLEIVEADLTGPDADARSTLTLGGMYALPGQLLDWHALRLEARAIAFERETGEAFTLEAFLDLGERCWTAWEKRTRPPPT